MTSQPVEAHIMKHQAAAKELVAQAYGALEALYNVAKQVRDIGSIYTSPTLDTTDKDADYLRNALGYDHLEAVFDTLPAVTMYAYEGCPARGEVLNFTQATERSWFSQGRSHDVWEDADATPEQMAALFRRFGPLAGWWQEPCQGENLPLPYTLRPVERTDDERIDAINARLDVVVDRLAKHVGVV